MRWPENLQNHISGREISKNIINHLIELHLEQKKKDM